MRRPYMRTNLLSTGCLATLTAAALAFAQGCGSSSETTTTTDAGAADGASVVDASDAGDGGAAGGLGFTPSNLGDVTLDTTDEVTLTDANCIVNADAAADPQTVMGISCIAGKRTRSVVTQPDGSKIVVYAMKSLTVKQGAHVTFEGPNVVAFVVAETVKIEGNLDASPTDLFMHTGRAGGALGKDGNADGNGPGAGKGADLASKVGGGGAGFCGAGGGAARAGKTYGNAEIVPLVAGSSGGGATGLSGGGGGGLQIVAGTSIEIATGGVLQAGGGGAARGAGGGSGGAILLEAPSVIVAGTLAANGGGGGNGLQGATGETGRPSAVAAKGGVDNTPANNGGDGSSAASVAGVDGVYVSDPGTGIADHGGGAGGGAGRIRINTTSGQAQIGGTVSPDLTSACATQGKLQVK